MTDKEPTVWQADKRPQKGGWAPGTYTCFCFCCKKTFMGDKRAVYCAPCTYGAIEA